jgi:hypothetical protein
MKKIYVILLGLLLLLPLQGQILVHSNYTAGTPPAAVDLLTGLVAYWKLDETSGLYYDSKGENDMTDNGATWGSGSNGKSGNAAIFVKANSDYLNATEVADLRMIDQDFTFAAWVYLNTSNPASTTTGIIGGETSAAGLAIYGSTEVIGIQNINNYSGNSSLTLPTAAWAFVAVAFDSDATTNNTTIYVNGTSEVITFNYNFGATSGTLNIGRYSYTAGYWDGLIDEVMMWKGRTLTVSELDAVYNSGTGLFFDSFE